MDMDHALLPQPVPPSLTMRSYARNDGSNSCPGPSCVLSENTLEIHGCPGPRCVHEAALEPPFSVPPKGHRRRGGSRRKERRSRLVASAAVPSATPSPARANLTNGAAHGMLPAAFRGLRPLSPLPSAYLQHLTYMAAHPHNRPDFQGQGRASRGAWMTIVPGYERGLASRDKELQAIQRQSGWDPADSPAVPLPFLL